MQHFKTMYSTSVIMCVTNKVYYLDCVSQNMASKPLEHASFLQKDR